MLPSLSIGIWIWSTRRQLHRRYADRPQRSHKLSCIRRVKVMDEKSLPNRNPSTLLLSLIWETN